MSSVTIGTTSVETAEIVSFDFNLHEPASELKNGEHMVLQATLRDGRFVAAEGDEAVTLKVLLASIGLVDQHGKPLPDAQNPAKALGVYQFIRNSPSLFF